MKGTFTHLSKARYASGVIGRIEGTLPMVDDIMIHIEGVAGEIRVAWYDFGDSTGVVPKLSLFSDAWKALSVEPDLFALLGAQDQTITPADLCDMLRLFGLVEDTEYYTESTAE